jgi:hypothetical protein
MGTCFFINTRVKECIAVTGKSGRFVAAQRDHAHAKTLEDGQKPQQFLGLATIGDYEHNIASRHNSEIAVDAFGRMEKERGCPRARQRRSDLLAYDPGLPDARYNYPAIALQDEIDCLYEFAVDP